MAVQISETSLRWASVSPSMYRWVVRRDRWPANICTSRNEPPARWTSRAARVMNVRRPEWDEQPSRPTSDRLEQTNSRCFVVALRGLARTKSQSLWVGSARASGSMRYTGLDELECVGRRGSWPLDRAIRLPAQRRQ